MASGKSLMIEIVEHRVAWAADFREIARVLRQRLGAAALRIDHIGSTAVPGLAAKDVIDVQVAGAALDEAAWRPLHALGYRRGEAIVDDHRPPGADGPETDWLKWFFRPPPGQRPTNLHVRVLGRANQTYPLLFRDYLRAHPLVAEAYGRLKRRLAAELRDVDAYPDVKDPAVDLIYLAAKDWALATDWKCAPSDA